MAVGERRRAERRRRGIADGCGRSMRADDAAAASTTLVVYAMRREAELNVNMLVK